MKAFLRCDMTSAVRTPKLHFFSSFFLGGASNIAARVLAVTSACMYQRSAYLGRLGTMTIRIDFFGPRPKFSIILLYHFSFLLLQNLIFSHIDVDATRQ